MKDKYGQNGVFCEYVEKIKKSRKKVLTNEKQSGSITKRFAAGPCGHGKEPSPSE